ncbi:MAG TPA: divergent polysaccharide deacetylase family protein [Pseudolabrys sp.]|nr:divergent polysaccharide deacetylase family protein [Pseudolabrys sp.]
MAAVAPDDLNAPLGKKSAPKQPRKLPIAVPQLVAGVLALLTVAVIGWAVFADDPLGGQPMAIVATARLSGASISGGDSKAGHHHDGRATTADKGEAIKTAAAPAPGSRTITIIDGSSGKRHDVIVPGQEAAEPTPSIDKRLLERTDDGSIPRIAPDGTRSFTRYASTRELPANRRDAPRISIIVGDLGISASATAEALSRLPASVTFALSPYGNNLGALAARARASDHELLLQVPMEPLDYPNNDPGPRTLLTTLAPAQNIERLHWLMARFAGYVGLASYMGARFTGSEPALSPVLHEAAKRGLIYLDDSASPRSVAARIASGLNLPFAKVDIVLDVVPTSTEIDRALTRLEMTAREHGSAVGYASAQPGAIARIADWAKTVESRGFALVPITMVALKAKSS